MTAQEFYTDVFGVTDQELLEELVSRTRKTHLRKGECIVRIGEVQKDVYFLVSGVARGYFLDDNGTEITDCFGFRCGTAAVSFGRMELNAPSPMTIEVLEEGDYFCIPVEDVLELQTQYTQVLELYNRLLVVSMEQHLDLQHVLHSCSAIQRYQWFLKEYPGLIHRINDKHVASFLGMTPVTLSRLRRTLREDKKTEL